jgi:hypothetical protein
MPNLLTLADPVQPPTIKHIRIIAALDTVKSAARFVLEVQAFGDDEFLERPADHNWRLMVSNGQCDKLTVNPSPTSLQDLFISETVTTEDDPALATAFDQVMGAFIMSGGEESPMLAAMVSLGLLPPGTTP